MTSRCKRSPYSVVVWLLWVTLGFASVGAADNSTDNSADHSAKTASEGSQGPETRTLASYAGEWSRIESVGSDRGRLESIAAAISDLSWIVRRMASGVLKKTTSPPTDVAFSWDGSALHQIVDGTNGRFKRPVKFGGEPLQLRDSRGEDFLSEWRWTEAGLEIHWTQSQAFGSNLYQLSDDGLLHVEHRIQVTALDGFQPIVYESTFDRGLPTAEIPELPAVSSIGRSIPATLQASELR